MTGSADELFCAVSTPAGTSGIAVIRISGNGAAKSIDRSVKIIRSSGGYGKVSELPGYTCCFADLRDPDTGVSVDKVVITRFEAPFSYTGDEMVEISADSGGEQKLSCTSECTLIAPDGTVGAVYDHYANCTRPTVREENGTIRISGSVTCSVMGEGSEGGLFCIEGQSPYEAEVAVPDGCTGCPLEAIAETAGCSYYLGESGSIKVRTDIRIVYKLFGGAGTKLVGSVKLDKEKPADRESGCALRLCRCGNHEDIWDIAKRCRTTVEAIMEDNSLPEGADSIDGGRMIVIRG